MTERVEHAARVILFRRRVTYAQLAKRIGYSSRHTEKILNGRGVVTKEFARRVSEYLGLPEGELFDPAGRVS
jgi:transcriptional regulator with XRE-family HTH domain